MSEMLEFIKSRRSTRKYANKAVEEEKLSEVLDFLKTIGLKADERVYGGITLGYADTPSGLPERAPLKRTGNEVTFI